METEGGGWTLFARFNGASTPSEHYGSSEFGSLTDSSQHYSLTTSKLGTVSKVLAKSPAGNKTWNFSAPQVMSVPTVGGYTVNLSGVGADGCTANRIFYNDSGCWGNRKAGPAISNSVGYLGSTCGSLGNWSATSKFYGRAHEGNNTNVCVPYGKWNQSQQEGIYSPMQEWYIK